MVSAVTPLQWATKGNQCMTTQSKTRNWKEITIKV